MNLKKTRSFFQRQQAKNKINPFKYPSIMTRGCGYLISTLDYTDRMNPKGIVLEVQPNKRGYVRTLTIHDLKEDTYTEITMNGKDTLVKSTADQVKISGLETIITEAGVLLIGTKEEEEYIIKNNKNLTTNRNTESKALKQALKQYEETFKKIIKHFERNGTPTTYKGLQKLYK